MIGFWTRVEKFSDGNWRKLALHTGIAYTTLYGWKENDRLPRVDHGIKIADAVGQSVRFLAFGVKDPEEERDPLFVTCESDAYLYKLCKMLSLSPRNRLRLVETMLNEFDRTEKGGGGGSSGFDKSQSMA